MTEIDSGHNIGHRGGPDGEGGWAPRMLEIQRKDPLEHCCRFFAPETAGVIRAASTRFTAGRPPVPCPKPPPGASSAAKLLGPWSNRISAAARNSTGRFHAGEPNVPASPFSCMATVFPEPWRVSAKPRPRAEGTENVVLDDGAIRPVTACRRVTYAIHGRFARRDHRLRLKPNAAYACLRHRLHPCGSAAKREEDNRERQR